MLYEELPLRVTSTKESPTHAILRLPVFRRNYDYGEIYPKMLDEYRAGRIDGVHDFMKKKRKEPSPIKMWKERRKKRKKKAGLDKVAVSQVETMLDELRFIFETFPNLVSVHEGSLYYFSHYLVKLAKTAALPQLYILRVGNKFPHPEYPVRLTLKHTRDKNLVLEEIRRLYPDLLPEQVEISAHWYEGEFSMSLSAPDDSWSAYLTFAHEEPAGLGEFDEETGKSLYIPDSPAKFIGDAQKRVDYYIQDVIAYEAPYGGSKNKMRKFVRPLEQKGVMAKQVLGNLQQFSEQLIKQQDWSQLYRLGMGLKFLILKEQSEITHDNEQEFERYERLRQDYIDERAKEQAANKQSAYIPPLSKTADDWQGQIFSNDDLSIPIKKLYQIAKQYPIIDIPISHLMEDLEEVEVDEPKDSPEFKRRVEKADLSYPIIVLQYPDVLRIADGVHRTWKAMLEDHTSIEAHVVPYEDLKRKMMRGAQVGFNVPLSITAGRHPKIKNLNEIMDLFTKGLTKEEIAEKLNIPAIQLKEVLPSLEENVAESVLEMYGQKFDVPEIASRLGLEMAEVLRILRKFQVKLRSIKEHLPADEIVQKYKDGQSLELLARDYGVSRPTIRQILERAGVEFRAPHRHPTKLPVDEIVRMYRDEGLSLSQISDKFVVDKNTIRLILMKEKVPMRGPGQYKSAESIVPLIKKAVPVVVEPFEPLVMKAVELLNQKYPGLLEQSGAKKIVLESGGPNHFGKVESDKPDTIFIALDKIKSMLSNQQNEQQLLEQVAMTIAHEAGHLKSKFQGGEAPAEAEERQFKSRLASIIPLSKTAGLEMPPIPQEIYDIPNGKSEVTVFFQDSKSKEPNATKVEDFSTLQSAYKWAQDRADEGVNQSILLYMGYVEEDLEKIQQIVAQKYDEMYGHLPPGGGKAVTVEFGKGASIEWKSVDGGDFELDVARIEIALATGFRNQNWSHLVTPENPAGDVVFATAHKLIPFGGKNA